MEWNNSSEIYGPLYLSRHSVPAFLKRHPAKSSGQKAEGACDRHVEEGPRLNPQQLHLKEFEVEGNVKGFSVMNPQADTGGCTSWHHLHATCVQPHTVSCGPKGSVPSTCPQQLQ